MKTTTKLTEAQLQALKLAFGHGRTCVREADACSSFVGKSLAAKGMVTRASTSRRTVTITVTDAGRAALKDGAT